MPSEDSLQWGNHYVDQSGVIPNLPRDGEVGRDSLWDRTDRDCPDYVPPRSVEAGLQKVDEWVGYKVGDRVPRVVQEIAQAKIVRLARNYGQSWHDHHQETPDIVAGLADSRHSHSEGVSNG